LTLTFCFPFAQSSARFIGARIRDKDRRLEEEGNVMGACRRSVWSAKDHKLVMIASESAAFRFDLPAMMPNSALSYC